MRSFIKAYDDVLASVSLTPIEKLVYLKYLSIQDERGSASVLNADLASQLGVSLQTIQRSVKALTENGFIRTTRVANKPNSIVVLPFFEKTKENCWRGEGCVYIMTSGDGRNKIGVTQHGNEMKRLNQVRRASGIDMSLVCSYTFSNRDYDTALNVEKSAHNFFKDSLCEFDRVFDGSREFFTVPVSEICSYLEQQGGKLVIVKQ